MVCRERKTNESLFDKNWYLRRGALHEQYPSENGFVTDKFGKLVLRQKSLGVQAETVLASSSIKLKRQNQIRAEVKNEV